MSNFETSPQPVVRGGRQAVPGRPTQDLLSPQEVARGAVASSHARLLRGAQLWVALFERHRDIAPVFEHHVHLRAVELGEDDGRAQAELRAGGGQWQPSAAPGW